MKKALVDDELVPASSSAPDHARCPGCGCELIRRKRKNGKGYTYYWRHPRGVAPDCPLRYTPLR